MYNMKIKLGINLQAFTGKEKSLLKIYLRKIQERWITLKNITWTSTRNGYRTL